MNKNNLRIFREENKERERRRCKEVREESREKERRRCKEERK